MIDTDRQNPLVDHLEELAKRDDRAPLAMLRRSLDEQSVFDGLPIVLPFIASNARDVNRAEDDALLLAGLFALHPESGPTSLPAALRQLAKTSDSVELRFRALLGAERSDLGVHLRHAVSLAASRHIALDWRELHTAIRFWDHPSGRARRTWARAFWSADDASTN
jgi:CRISPR system Cascade subunit CasB